MATLWVSTLGDNGNSGATYALAKADPYAAIVAASQGDTINIVADGVHKMGTFTQYFTDGYINSGFAGTSWSDPGLVIRGCDSSGAPAIATMQMDDSESRVSAFRMGNDARYITVQGIRFDYTPGAATTSSNRRALYFQNAQPFRRFYNCEFAFGDLGGTFAGSTPTAFFSTGTSGATAGTFEVANCVFINFPMNATFGDHDTLITYDIHHNVIIFDGVTQLSQLTWVFTTGTLPRRFYSNTVIRRAYGNTAAAPLTASASDDTAQLFSHSNLLYIECGPDNATTGIGSFVRSGYAVATAEAALRDSHNMFVLGPTIDTFYSGWTTDANGLSSYQYNYNFRDGVAWTGQDIEPNSELVRDKTYADVFFDATVAPWAWVTNGYTNELPWDMRPLIGRFAAYDGDVVGAVLDSINEPPVVSGPQTWSVTAGSTIVVDASSGLNTVCADPDGDVLSFILVGDVTHGMLTFNGTLGAYDYTPDPTYVGVDQFTWHVTDGLYTVTFIDSTTQTPYVQFNVLPYPVVPPDNNPPVSPVYLDTAPLFAPDLRVDALLRYKSIRNKIPYKLLDGRMAGRWIESTHRVIHVAAGDERAINLGGIETARALLVESDAPVEISVNSASAYWPVDGVAAVIETSVTSVYVKNDGSDEAVVHLFALD